MRKLLISFFLILLSIHAFGEEVEVKAKKPFKAAALSLFIPGGGQLYNGAYLKSTGVIVLESGMIGLAAYHHFKAEDSYDKYRISGSEDDYNDYLNYYYKRQSDLWWLGAVVFLSTIDAFVDAHLFDFEEKKNKIHLKFEDNIVSLSYHF